MFARLLTLTESIQTAARAAGVLPFRTVIRLTKEEWNELAIDPIFRLLIDPSKTYVTVNDVIIRHEPVTSHIAAQPDMPRD